MSESAVQVKIPNYFIVHCSVADLKIRNYFIVHCSVADLKIPNYFIVHCSVADLLWVLDQEMIIQCPSYNHAVILRLICTQTLW